MSQSVPVGPADAPDLLDEARRWIEELELGHPHEGETEKLLKGLVARCARLEAENAQLRRFFEKCWDNARDGTDVDGGDVLDWGEELGLLKPVEASAPCGDGCYCAEYYGEFPATCYRLAWAGGAPSSGTPQ